MFTGISYLSLLLLTRLFHKLTNARPCSAWIFKWVFTVHDMWVISINMSSLTGNPISNPHVETYTVKINDLHTHSQGWKPHKCNNEAEYDRWPTPKPIILLKFERYRSRCNWLCSNTNFQLLVYSCLFNRNAPPLASKPQTTTLWMSDQHTNTQTSSGNGLKITEWTTDYRWNVN
jgi:hypothetical protein